MKKFEERGSKCGELCLEEHPAWYHRCCYCESELNPDNSIVINGKCRSCGNRTAKESWELHKEERTERRKKRYAENPDYYRNKAKLQRQELRGSALKVYGGDDPICMCCGEMILEFLALDHINNDGAVDRKENGNGASYYQSLKSRGYPEGLQILCHNCNMAKSLYGECPHELLELESGKELLSFRKYMYLHPSERFWQALRNWSGVDYIFKGMSTSTQGGERVIYDTIPVYLKDTFYE